ncbi:MAG: hypothetical protein LBI28_09095 [Treponema sp.]|jgi:hypothetical protein|nr:hypothetical protein [Treponema sp.]
MKNFFKLFKIITLFTAISFLMITCVTTNNKVNTSLNGVWDRGDIVITFIDSNGIFTEIKSDSWLRARNNGNISIGDRKYRNITQTDNLIWTAQELTLNSRDFSITGWSNCTITMDENGQTIRILTQGDVLNPDNTYTRVE